MEALIIIFFCHQRGERKYFAVLAGWLASCLEHGWLGSWVPGANLFLRCSERLFLCFCSFFRGRGSFVNYYLLVGQPRGKGGSSGNYYFLGGPGRVEGGRGKFLIINFSRKLTGGRWKGEALILIIIFWALRSRVWKRKFPGGLQ